MRRYKGTFVLAFADGTLQDLDLKGVSFEIVHNPAVQTCAADTERESGLEGLVPVVEPGAEVAKDYDLQVAQQGNTAEAKSHRFHSAAEYKEDPLRFVIFFSFSFTSFVHSLEFLQ